MTYTVEKLPLFFSQQLQRFDIGSETFAHDGGDAGLADVGNLAEFVAGFDVGHMDLDRRDPHSFYRVQDRYRSEPVQDNAYFLTVLRYILYNPVKAGICKAADQYPFSSARDYFNGGGITDTSFAEEMTGKQALLDFLKMPSDDACMDETPSRLNERDAKDIILETAGGKDMADCQRIIASHPDHYVPILRKSGLSIRQISRLTGLSIGIVRK